jgi:hypothetical protein
LVDIEEDTMTKSLAQLRKDRRIDEIQVDEGHQRSYFVYLTDGWILEEQHCFGEDRVKDIEETMKRVTRCFCSPCLRRLWQRRIEGERKNPMRYDPRFDDPEEMETVGEVIDCPECGHRGKFVSTYPHTMPHCSHCGFVGYTSAEELREDRGEDHHQLPPHRREEDHDCTARTQGSCEICGSWMDPAGGVHDKDDDPAKAYE